MYHVIVFKHGRAGIQWSNSDFKHRHGLHLNCNSSCFLPWLGSLCLSGAALLSPVVFWDFDQETSSFCFIHTLLKPKAATYSFGQWPFNNSTFEFLARFYFCRNLPSTVFSSSPFRKQTICSTLFLPDKKFTFLDFALLSNFCIIKMLTNPPQ